MRRRIAKQRVVPMAAMVLDVPVQPVSYDLPMYVQERDSVLLAYFMK